MLIFWLGLVILVLTALSFVWLPYYQASRQGVTSIAPKTLALTSLAIVVFSGIVYYYWGASSAVAKQVAYSKLQSEIGSPEQLILRMQAHLSTHPESAQGWYLLGKVYLSLGRYTEARDALAKASQLQPDQPEYLLNYQKAKQLESDNSLG